MSMKRRDFAKNMALTVGAVGTASILTACSDEKEPLKSSNGAQGHMHEVSPEVSEAMYKKALEITKKKIRGGDSEPFFKKPFIDAAFSANIFLWDTCFMCCFAKYHLDELPVYQALDNFYDRMEDDGYICREYRQTGEPLWPKTHPVSINPPLLAFAEIEIFKVDKNIERIKKVYPILKKNFQFHVNNYMMEDNLFYGDTLGMGMDNIPRYPRDWKPTAGNGMTHHEIGEKLNAMSATAEEKLNTFIVDYMESISGVWNKQGRLVDFSAQMAMYAIQLKEMAETIGETEDIPEFEAFHKKVAKAINDKCWNEEDGFYYDLALDKHMSRRHIGAYWTLLGKVVPDDKLERFLTHLTDKNEFDRIMPLPALSAADPDYVGWGDYWLGGVWAPTTYMVLRGLSAYGKEDLARAIAKKTYANVATVFEATDTFWENYAPDLVSYGLPAKKDFCGWTGLYPIAMYNEYIKNL
ncbi:MAG: trehalase family glycosidase [Bacteroidota bacterium]